MYLGQCVKTFLYQTAMFSPVVFVIVQCSVLFILLHCVLDYEVAPCYRSSTMLSQWHHADYQSGLNPLAIIS